MAIKFRTAYSPQKHVTIKTGHTGGAKQHHKDECDVNLIVAKFQKTGIVAHRQQYEPQYDDATPVDYQEALNLVNSANQMFMDLPSSLRKQFDHNPAEFYEFVQNPDNQEQLIKMGLATPPEPPAPPIEVVIKGDTPSDPV